MFDNEWFVVVSFHDYSVFPRINATAFILRCNTYSWVAFLTLADSFCVYLNYQTALLLLFFSAHATIFSLKAIP